MREKRFFIDSSSKFCRKAMLVIHKYTIYDTTRYLNSKYIFYITDHKKFVPLNKLVFISTNAFLAKHVTDIWKSL